MEDQTRVDIKKLIYRVLRHWRSILVFAVLCAVLANFFGMYRDRKQGNRTEEYVSQSSLVSAEEEVAASAKKLNDFDKDLVDKAFTTYWFYQKMYEESLLYASNSLIYKMNPYHVPMLSITLYIDNHFTVTYPEMER